MSLRRFGLVTRALDPNKYARLVQKGLITELNQDVTNGISYIESSYSKRELKVKLGLTYEKDIVEHNTVENPVDNKKAENTGESKPVESEEIVSDGEKSNKEINLDQKESELSLKESKLSLKESELNKKESDLNKKELELKQKELKLSSEESESELKLNQSMSESKFKLKLEIPELLCTEYDDINTYAMDLRTFKRLMKDVLTDEEIIFSSLVKSKKTALKGSMTTKEETSLDDYIKFLCTIYGYSPSDMWKRLRSVTQKKGENVLQFFNRVVKLFYSCRNTEVPSTISDEAHQQEIRNIFISGLNNIDLRKQLNMNEVAINFQDLGKTAQSYENGLRSAGEITDALKVLNIESGFMRNDYNERKTYRWGREDRSRDRGRSRSRDRDGYKEQKFGRSPSRDRNNGYDKYELDERRCFRCGQIGHLIRDCRASARTVRDYHRRNRSRSRENRVQFDDEQK